MNGKMLVVYLVTIVVLAISITTYYVSSYAYENKAKNTVNQQITSKNDEVKDDNVEYVGDYTLKKIQGNKAYFMEKLPSYLYGRTGDNSIDMRFYKTSRFKEGVNFKLIRIYTKDDSGNVVHKYRFESQPNK